MTSAAGDPIQQRTADGSIQLGVKKEEEMLVPLTVKMEPDEKPVLEMETRVARVRKVYQRCIKRRLNEDDEVEGLPGGMVLRPRSLLKDRYK
ncbi:hypothetical protein L210DRAFT_3652771 [Boletus edulis BED1]|uniref:Uncharacterized protein n=1 Tax=Boletus edulis BED1 TaxID=1328754 RepID=A0AAD4G7U6_BOLED|nr:hypothetical protein L210DRAFT_3652771 [Boletus edulis BED1]